MRCRAPVPIAASGQRETLISVARTSTGVLQSGALTRACVGARPQGCGLGGSIIEALKTSHTLTIKYARVPRNAPTPAPSPCFQTHLSTHQLCRHTWTEPPHVRRSACLFLRGMQQVANMHLFGTGTRTVANMHTACVPMSALLIDAGPVSLCMVGAVSVGCSWGTTVC